MWVVVPIALTMDHWLSQIGISTKHLTERHAEYPAPTNDQQLYYAYEPSSPSHGQVISSKHHYSGGGHKSGAAMSALTLLAFLFFLHILQQCLKEHMTDMSAPQVMVVSAGREGEQILAKSNKLDKAGLVRDVIPTTEVQQVTTSKNKLSDEDDVQNPAIDRVDNFLTRIVTAQHTPRGSHKYSNKMVGYTNSSSIFDGFVSAMNDK